MKKTVSKKEKTNVSSSALSDAEVARFLKQLASLYKDKRSGNPELAEALTRLAHSLLSPADDKRPSEFEQPLPDLTAAELQSMDADAINQFLCDETKTKNELIGLASFRFAIPRAKLQRMKLEEVREAIRSSLRHEESLRIIKEEADQFGMTRQS
ncbi:hypothetical protein [Sediminibacterium sp.]|uniref:hypothetical protein n=1 Tax=Sediminibacterium sp. TaxID=1917865 RepID=UPI002733915E|nr:hypothetical protein [Sediminibacterium sp.]MDP3566418.1 hypothetical protein [Sediminibacterium sp.]